MKLNIFIHDEIIRRARALLDTIKAEENSSSQKTKQQRDLDAIWSRHPNEPFWVTDFAEVVKVLNGYRPNTIPGKRENFQVMVRPGSGTVADQPWIILKNNVYGFANLNVSYYVINQFDRLATIKEAEAFIKGLENLDSETLYRWIISSLGADTVTSF